MTEKEFDALIKKAGELAIEIMEKEDLEIIEKMAKKESPRIS